MCLKFSESPEELQENKNNPHGGPTAYKDNSDVFKEGISALLRHVENILLRKASNLLFSYTINDKHMP